MRTHRCSRKGLRGLSVCSVKTTLSVCSVGTNLLTPARWISHPLCGSGPEGRCRSAFPEREKVVSARWSLSVTSLCDKNPRCCAGRKNERRSSVSVSCRLFVFPVSTLSLCFHSYLHLLFLLVFVSSLASFYSSSIPLVFSSADQSSLMQICLSNSYIFCPPLTSHSFIPLCFSDMSRKLQKCANSLYCTVTHKHSNLLRDKRLSTKRRDEDLAGIRYNVHVMKSIPLRVIGPLVDFHSRLTKFLNSAK